MTTLWKTVRHGPLLALLCACGGITSASPNSAVEVVDPYGTSYGEARQEADDANRFCGTRVSRCESEPAAIGRVLHSGGCGEEMLTWRTLGSLRNVAPYVDRLQKLGGSLTKFNCDRTGCSVIVATKPTRETDSTIRTLSVCSVSVVGETVGAPTNCHEALKYRGAAPLLVRAKTSDGGISCSIGLPDFGVVFTGRANQIESIRAMASDILHAPPFQLQVMRSYDDVVGTRSFVASGLFKGWREWSTVTISVRARGADAGVIVATTLLVSKGASVDRESWSPASEPQEQSYVTRLQQEFQKRGGSLRTAGGL